jgi:hypothetical protein
VDMGWFPALAKLYVSTARGTAYPVMNSRRWADFI